MHHDDTCIFVYLAPGDVQRLVGRDEPTTWISRRLTYQLVVRPLCDTTAPRRELLPKLPVVLPTGSSRVHVPYIMQRSLWPRPC